MQYYYPNNCSYSSLPEFDNVKKTIHQVIIENDDSNEEAYLLKNDTRDFDTPIFGDEYKCIDLDYFECIRTKKRKTDKNNKPSMDFSFLINNPKSQKIEAVLVELRLNFKVPSNIIKEDLDKKSNASSQCIKKFFKYDIYPKKFFIFPSKKCAEFERRLRRMNPACSPDYHAVSVSSLYNLFFKQQA